MIIVVTMMNHVPLDGQPSESTNTQRDTVELAEGNIVESMALQVVRDAGPPAMPNFGALPPLPPGYANGGGGGQSPKKTPAHVDDNWGAQPAVGSRSHITPTFLQSPYAHVQQQMAAVSTGGAADDDYGFDSDDDVSAAC